MEDLKGKLSAEFRSTNLAALHHDFFAAAGATDKNKAAQVLNDFYRAAGKLDSSENEFNRRDRLSSGTPSLLANLRNPLQFAALREFSRVRGKILEMHPEIGIKIIRAAEESLDMK